MWRPNPDLHTTNEFSYSATSNSWGVRDREFSVEDLTGETILMLGDSMTFGLGVDLEDTFPKLLEADYRKAGRNTLVINGGGLGASTIQQYRSLMELAGTSKFSAVGFCFYLGNDSDDNFLHADHPQSIRAAIEHELSSNSVGKTLLRNFALPNLVYMRLRAILYDWDLVESFQGKKLIRRKTSPRERTGWRATEGYVHRIREFQDANPDTHIFFVLLPQDFQVDPEKQRRYGLSERV